MLKFNMFAGSLPSIQPWLSPSARPWAPYMAALRRQAHQLLALVCGASLAGCASTSIKLDPSPQAPVCEPTVKALILWSPEWRPDQKDVVERETAAATGLKNFFGDSGCFAQSELRRIQSVNASDISTLVASETGQFTQVVVIGVRELGPVVQLLSSVALVDGGTEVVLNVTTYSLPEVAQPREFSIHWRNGGPGVVKGVASLPGDIQAALRAGLM